MKLDAEKSATPPPTPRLETVLRTYFPFLLLPDLPTSPEQALTKRMPAAETFN